MTTCTKFIIILQQSIYLNKRINMNKIENKLTKILAILYIDS
jgi:hypothetical protein